MINNWRTFWEEYRKMDPVNEDDLFFQVGKTSNQKPISKRVFQNIVKDIVDELELQKEDVLLEMCCGNGLFTYELVSYVKKIYAFDFTKSLIDSANKFKAHHQIVYAVGDANHQINSIFPEQLPTITKYLMSDAMAYFTPEQLNNLLNNIRMMNASFTLYLTNVPNDAKKWNFYNTEERKEKYGEALEKGDCFLEGMGRWWKKEEFEFLAKKHKLEVKFVEAKDDLNYRISVLYKGVYSLGLFFCLS